jgi:hypothetical protein
MHAKLRSKLERFKSDYKHLRGTSFSHLCCPVLFNDEDVELCKAHIVNLAFPNSSRAWTVQRKDVDSFYGRMFEDDFGAIQYNEDRNLGKTVTDKKLARKFEPKILVDGQPVEFFVARDKVPHNFTPLIFDGDGTEVQLGLKISPQDMLAAVEKNWQIAIDKDVRVATAASLIKAAHLTLFEMLGYRYALSAAGHFVGREVLGEFFLRNRGRQKTEVLQDALSFFREFAAMVRPVESSRTSMKGTLVDRQLLFCKEDRAPIWAYIVFVKISESLHAVMIPTLNEPYSASKFIRFLRDENEAITASPGSFEQDHWAIQKQSIQLSWPKTGILYP